MYRIEVKYDIFPQSFAWKVTEPVRGQQRRRKNGKAIGSREGLALPQHKSHATVLVSYPLGSIEKPFRRLVKRVQLQRGRTYRLVLREVFGLGLVGGYVKIYRGSKLLRRIKGESIGRRKSVTFRAR